MSWVRVDDAAPEHPKFLLLAERAGGGERGAAAAWLWLCGVAYCNRQSARDGFIPRAKVPQLYPVRGALGLAARLVEAGLWETTDGGFLVHDYHRFQPSPEARANLAEKRREAGRRGGLASGAARRGEALPEEPTTLPAGPVDAFSGPSAQDGVSTEHEGSEHGATTEHEGSEHGATTEHEGSDDGARREREGSAKGVRRNPQSLPENGEAICFKQTNPHPGPSRPIPAQPEKI